MPGRAVTWPVASAQQGQIAAADDQDIGGDQADQRPVGVAQRGNAVGGENRQPEEEKKLGALMRLQ